MNDVASISRLDTPLWDALERAVHVPFPTARLTPQFVVGFTDARIYRELGAVAYGAGLFSPSLDSSEYGSRFHGNNERIDIDSLASHHQAVPRRRHRPPRLTPRLPPRLRDGFGGPSHPECDANGGGGTRAGSARGT